MINIGLTDYAPLDKIIDIRDKDQVIKAKYVIGDDGNHTQMLMSDHYVEISFVLDTLVNFERTDYIVWEGIVCTLKEDYKPDEVNSVHFAYTLRFEAPEMFLQDAQMYYTRQDLKEGTWSLTSDARTFVNIAVINANRYFGVSDWQVGTIEPVTTEFITFDSISVFDALTQIAETFNAEWYVTGKTIHLVNKVQFGLEVEFKNEVSVLSMSQSDGDEVSGFTRIVALGSTRNISPNYRDTGSGEAVDAIYQKRLRIPISKGSTIDAWENMTPLQAVETTVIFEDVYPHRIGTMSDITTKEYTDTNTDTGVVTKWNAFRYKDTGLSFKEEYKIPNIDLKIHFVSGYLNGLDFIVKFNPDKLSETDPDAQQFEIVRNTDYGAALPNDTLKPVNGDTYILYGFDIELVADQYIPISELELYDEGRKWLENNLKDKSVYSCPTVIQHFYENEMDLEIGQKVKLVNGRFENGSRSSRIMGFEKKLINKYDAVYTVGDNSTYTWRNEVDSNIQELQYAGQVFQNTANNSGVYLIKQFDNTPPSEFNAYSATASNARYFNRQTGGTVQGLTTFQQDVRVQGKTISDIFQNETFTSGQFGSGFKMWRHENGQSYAEFDNLLVRRETIFNKLTIAEIQSVGGQILVSLANMTCSNVIEQSDGYKCFFDTDNGTIPNYFALNDQVICRRWNGKNIKSYWRRILSLGTDYIILSKTDADGYGVPASGDDMVQFGNRTNVARQLAIMISAYGSDAPSIKFYKGINSYDLTGKERTVVGDNSKFTGTFIIEATGEDVSTLFQQLKDQIALKVNQTTFDLLSNRVTNAEASIIINANNITSTVEKVNSIQIGGRNLLSNSSFEDGKPVNVGSVNAAILTVVYGGFIGNQSIKVVTSPTIANSGFAWQSLPTITGKTYVVSGYLRSDIDIENIRCWATNSNYGYINGIYVNTTTSWNRFSLTFQATETGTTKLLITALNSIFFVDCIQLEEGNKETSWRYSQEDIQQGIDTAQITATNAATTASNAQTSATTANNLLSDIANDNLLVPSEKQSTLLEWNVIQSEYTKNITQATNFSVSSAAYTTAYNAMNTYITPLLSNLTTTSTIVGATFRSTFKAYYDARTELLNAISTKARDLANTAQSTADTKNKTYRQDAQPTAPSGGFKDGDLWFKTSLVDIDGNINADSTKNIAQLQYRWSGTTWVQINWSASRSKIIQTDSRITSIVESTDINSLGVGRELKSLIDQTPGQIQLAVNSIQIGGRNLLQNSSFEFGYNYNLTSINSAVLAIVQGGFDGNSSVRTISSSTASSGFGFSGLPTITGQTYTVSLYVRSDAAISNLTFSVLNSSYQTVVNKLIDTNTSWNRFSLTFVATQTGTMRVAVLKSSATFYIDCVQLEDGNKMTAWNAASQDIPNIAGSTLTLTNNKIALGSNTIELNGNTVARAIQAEELNVGNGNFKVGTDGIVKAKGAIIEGTITTGETGERVEVNKGTNSISVINNENQTKVSIKPNNITPIANIGNASTSSNFTAGGVAASDTITASSNANISRTYNSQNFTLPNSNVYDVDIDPISILADATSDSNVGASAYSVAQMLLINTVSGQSTNIISLSTNNEIVASNKKITVNSVQPGTYYIRIYINIQLSAPPTAHNASARALYSIPSNTKLTVRPLQELTEIGLNGLMSAFNSSKYFHITSSAAIFRYGDYMLRITSNEGIQKSANGGGSWTNL